MVATFPSALLLLCLPSLIISSPEPNAMQPKLRSPRHILSHFLEKIHQGLHTKEEKQEDQEEGEVEFDHSEPHNGEEPHTGWESEI